MMSKYAQNTSVSPDRSKAEIEKTLRRYGADSFMYGWEENRALIAFRADGRRVKFVLPMPSPNDESFRLTPTGKARSVSAWESEYDQAIRQRWRALALVIKAKLEAVDTGIVTFDEEFLAHLLLPSGETVGERAMPEYHKILADGGSMPPLLLETAKEQAP